ncbi:MAG: two-component system response regulator [Methylococcaceae bacterium]|nr:two-component system response regulator [Methylococcaceae bacterium]
MNNQDNRPGILIVDDSLGNIEVLSNILGKGYSTSFACNGTEALTLIARNSPDLVLLDVVMPGIDGFEVCKHLKSDPVTRDIPVIFLTSLDSAVDEEYGLSLGAEDFIHKPASPPVVLARVRNHLMLAKAKRELKRHNENLEFLVAERTEEVERKNRQLIAAQSSIITAFCALAEVRDNETGNHIRRTQNYIRLLAQQLRSNPRYPFTDTTVELLFKTAPLHDIGKVAIPDAILLKPGKFSTDEWKIMKRHCEVGRSAILSAARDFGDSDRSFLNYAIEIAYCHHEKWDGSGYPQGLSGDAIPVSARLMAVADVYDALITKRVYKEAYSHEEAVRLIKEGRGTQFDPDVIDAFLAITDAFDTTARLYKDTVEPATETKIE